MAGCCPSGDYPRFFNRRFAGRLARRDRKRGLDKTARKMVELLQALGIQGSSVLEIGGGVGEVEVELLRAGAARAKNLELSPAYQDEARELAAQAGLQGRIDWRIHDLAQDPGAVAPADLVVLHRVVCCYPDYQRLLAAAADHARRALVFSYPPSNALSRAFYAVFNLVMRLTRSGFRGFAHPAGRDARVLEDHGLRRTFQHRGRIWQVAASSASREGAALPGQEPGQVRLADRQGNSSDLAGAVGTEVLGVHAGDLALELGVAHRSGRGGSAFGVVGGRGDRQHLAGRLDPNRSLLASMKAIISAVGGRAPPRRKPRRS